MEKIKNRHWNGISISKILYLVLLIPYTMLPLNGKEVTVSLTGTVIDDDKSGRPVTSTWSAGSAPGKVRFADANKSHTNVTLTGAGDYVLTLTASDGKIYPDLEIEAPYVIVKLQR